MASTTEESEEYEVKEEGWEEFVEEEEKIGDWVQEKGEWGL